MLAALALLHIRSHSCHIVFALIAIFFTPHRMVCRCNRYGLPMKLYILSAQRI